MAKTPELEDDEARLTDDNLTDTQGRGQSSSEDEIAPERLAWGGDLREYYEQSIRKLHPERSEQEIMAQVDRAMKNVDLVNLLRDTKEFDEKLKLKLPGWRTWFDHD